MAISATLQIAQVVVIAGSKVPIAVYRNRTVEGTNYDGDYWSQLTQTS
jgi:hypothetical protein